VAVERDIDDFLVVPGVLRRQAAVGRDGGCRWAAPPPNPVTDAGATTTTTTTTAAAAAHDRADRSFMMGYYMRGDSSKPPEVSYFLQ
jgi:hypothetical protein